ncbi:MAG: hypothetical protein GX591_02450, partial [Planctomycetes bacterium]|nr:hypothetical protein [Planctomycetota bacterium]
MSVYSHVWRRIVPVLLIGAVAQAALADLSGAFDGFDAVFEARVSGLTSSYFDYTRAG